MAMKLYSDVDIQDIADAIRELNGSSDTYKVSEMAAAIRATIHPSYTNLADPSSADWKDGYRITSTGIAAQAGKTICNPVSVAIGDVIRVKGVSFIANADRYQITGVNSGGTTTFGRDYISRLPNSALNYTMDGDVHVFTVLDQNIVTDGALCFAFNTPSDASTIIITKNEVIT